MERLIFNLASYGIQILLHVEWVQVTECLLSSKDVNSQESESGHFYCLCYTNQILSRDFIAVVSKFWL